MHSPHQIVFCADDAALLDGLTRFIAAALGEGNPAIVWATESHRDANEGLTSRRMSVRQRTRCAFSPPSEV
jgi:hypothetical protein